jgi:hypothetical protein
MVPDDQQRPAVGHRRRNVGLGVAVAVAVLVVAAVAVATLGHGKAGPTTAGLSRGESGSAITTQGGASGSATTSPTVPTLGPEEIAIPNGPLLAGVDTANYPGIIDGIPCETNEQLVYHIHAHLTIFVDGVARQIPYGIGITPPLQQSTAGGVFVDGGLCFYWLHTHAADGVIHIESPTETVYTLGQFFDVWGQALGTTQVGSVTGPLTIFVDGQPYTGNPQSIPLTAHTQVQLDVGLPAPAQTLITFPLGL